MATSVKNGIFVSRPGTEPKGVPILRISAVRPGELQTDDVRYSGKDERELAAADALLVPGDLLFTRYNGNIDYVGACALVPRGLDLLTYPDKLIRVRVDAGLVDSAFIGLAFNASTIREQVRSLARTTAGQAGISGASLRAVRLPLPPLVEQRRMVTKIETLFSHLTAATESVATGGARLKLLTKRVLVESVPVTGKPGWRIITVGQAGKVDLGRQRHPDWHTGPNMRPYLRVANVFEDRIDLRDVMQMDFPPEVFERFRLTPGDILLNEGQSPEYLGRPAMYRGEPAEMAFTNSLLRFRAYEGIDPEWALLVFRRHMHAGRFIKEVRITTNIAHLSASRFKEVEFPVPPIEEQRAIVAQTKERLDGLTRLADSVQLAGVRAGRLREALLAEAFAGRLVEQDPADEPASELLARIRAQRVKVPKQRGRRTAKELAAPATRAIGTDFQQGELPL
ncbi:hypothetical protein ACN27F_12145 [Solwaraspora sp. WMMB335]|uniref:restriction endonuclease subunit S n=1 Tax=Solwaraspora sp. WMMB335 TaxID=3404118 RepID=UPI003B94BF97